MSNRGHTEFYDLLGIKPNANEKEITKGFRKAAQQWHPDKWQGQDKTEAQRKTAEEKFKRLARAYEVLNDKNLREVYDNGGEEALANGGHQSMSEEDIAKMFGGGGIFSQMFGNMGGMFGNMGGAQREKEHKFPSIIQEIDLDFKQIYFGEKITFEVTRYSLKKDKNPTKSDIICKECKGNGFVMKVHRRGNMIQQSQGECTTCKGKCMIFSDEFFDSKIQKFTKPVPKGIYNGKKIVIPDKGHEIPEAFRDNYPGQTRSDIILVVSEQKKYRVDGYEYERGVENDPSNLKVKLTITPCEALCGVVKAIPFITGELISVTIPFGTCFKEEKYVAKDQSGMPVYKKNRLGDLYVILEINEAKEFNLSTKEIEKIGSIMGTDLAKENKKTLAKTEGKTIAMMHAREFQEKKQKRNYNNATADSDSDDDRGGNSRNRSHGGHFGGQFGGGGNGSPECVTQ